MISLVVMGRNTFEHVTENKVELKKKENSYFLGGKN
jgi:dihydrofolate reductase